MRGFWCAFDAVCKAEAGGWVFGVTHTEEREKVIYVWRVKKVYIRQQRITVRMYLLQDLWVDILYIIRRTEGQKNEARERHSSVA